MRWAFELVLLVSVVAQTEAEVIGSVGVGNERLLQGSGLPFSVKLPLTSSSSNLQKVVVLSDPFSTKRPETLSILQNGDVLCTAAGNDFTDICGDGGDQPCSAGGYSHLTIPCSLYGVAQHALTLKLTSDGSQTDPAIIFAGATAYGTSVDSVYGDGDGDGDGGDGDDNNGGDDGNGGDGNDDDNGDGDSNSGVSISNMELAHYLIIEMHTAHNPTARSFLQSTIYPKLNVEPYNTAQRSDINSFYNALLPYSFTTATQQQVYNLGLPANAKTATDNSATLNAFRSPYLTHALAHGEMVQNYPRCKPTGGMIYDVPVGESASRPLHLFDLIGYLTFENGVIQTSQFVKTGSVQNNAAYEYVQNHFPNAVSVISQYDMFEQRILRTDFNQFTTVLRTQYAKPNDKCNGGPYVASSTTSDLSSDATHGTTTSTHGSHDGASVLLVVGVCFPLSAALGFALTVLYKRHNDRRRATVFTQMA